MKRSRQRSEKNHFWANIKILFLSASLFMSRLPKSIPLFLPKAIQFCTIKPTKAAPHYIYFQWIDSFGFLLFPQIENIIMRKKKSSFCFLVAIHSCDGFQKKKWYVFCRRRMDSVFQLSIVYHVHGK